MTAPLRDGSADANPGRFWALVAEDYRTHRRNWASPGFWALFWHRFGNWRMGVRPKLLRMPLTLLYRVMYWITSYVFGIELPYTVAVGRRVCIEHAGGIVISARAIGDDVVLRQNTTLGLLRTSEVGRLPAIGNGVDIGVGAVILGEIEVGDGAVIGANAVVTKHVPPGARALGVPARILERP